jgi:5-methylcytosine-specific restriction endonuclease McrA/DNA-directed RNA polymerase subunit RPC12/RpoP
VRKKYYCIDCNKEVSKYNVKRCSSCEAKRRHKEGIFNSQKENNPNFKHDKTNNNKCIDCGKKIGFRSTRCKSCARKFLYKDPSKHPQFNKKRSIETILKIIKTREKNNIGVTHGLSRKNIKHYCVDCGKEVSDYRNKRCHPCAMKKIDRDPRKHPCYIDGRSFEKYPKKFNIKLREKIRNRDNYICQNCSMTEEEHLIVAGRVLHVHHIDYNRKNCEEENLITLCQWCNLRANKNRDYWLNYYQNKIGEKYGIKDKGRIS